MFCQTWCEIVRVRVSVLWTLEWCNENMAWDVQGAAGCWLPAAYLRY